MGNMTVGPSLAWPGLDEGGVQNSQLSRSWPRQIVGLRHSVELRATKRLYKFMLFVPGASLARHRLQGLLIPVAGPDMVVFGRAQVRIHETSKRAVWSVPCRLESPCGRIGEISAAVAITSQLDLLHIKSLYNVIPSWPQSDHLPWQIG